MIDRIVRISEEIKRELSVIIQNDLKDPRLPNLISITNVNVTKDLKFAKVHVSVFGSDEEKKNAMAALKSAAGFIRREIGNRVQLRAVPQLNFEIDNSIEYGVNLAKLIEQTMQESKSE